MIMFKHMAAEDDGLQTWRHRVRLVILLDAAENAGLSPVSVRQLHTFAYLANVLAPVWDLPAMEGKVLKRLGGPFYPTLQRDLDRLVGAGVVIISEMSHELDEEQHWRLHGCYRLNRNFSDPILNGITELDAERELLGFIYELAHALSAMSGEDIERSMVEDAAYGDSIVDFGDIVDFAEWKEVNQSANAARYLANLLPGGLRATDGEMLHFYIQHLHSRLHGAY